MRLGFPQANKPKVYIEGRAQGTTYHITYYADSVVSKQQIDSILLAVDSSLSIYKPYSLISKFNTSVRGVTMDRHLGAVAKRSLEIYRETGGISDITVYPLVDAWGFGPDHPQKLPDSATIAKLLLCVGSNKLRITGGKLIKSKPCVKIDVNGIAQGYSVDVVADFLQRHHIQNYLVEIGGELRIKGRKPDGSLMRIGIEAPAKNSLDEPVMERVVAVSEGAITTSGNYRKYAESGGKRLSHLMNPHTGYPFQNELVSVTVRARNAITADGYDNVLMGMGLKRSFGFLRKHREMEAFFIYRKPDGALADTATAGFFKP